MGLHDGPSVQRTNRYWKVVRRTHSGNRKPNSVTHCLGWDPKFVHSPYRFVHSRSFGEFVESTVTSSITREILKASFCSLGHKLVRPIKSTFYTSGISIIKQFYPTLLLNWFVVYFTLLLYLKSVGCTVCYFFMNIYTKRFKTTDFTHSSVWLAIA